MLRAAQHDNTVERISLSVFLVILRPLQRLHRPHQSSSVQNADAVWVEPGSRYNPILRYLRLVRFCRLPLYASRLTSVSPCLVPSRPG